jgi:hypothetical protein
MAHSIKRVRRVTPDFLSAEYFEAVGTFMWTEYLVLK